MPSEAGLAEVFYFAKICPKHALPMIWTKWKRLDEGWSCQKCRGNCPVHGFPLRPKRKGAYCRQCVRAKIVAESREVNHVKDGAGVAIILGRQDAQSA